MLRHVFAALALCVAMVPAARATSVIPLYLEEIVDQSTVAFEGIVTDNHSARDEKGLVVTYTTFAVQDVLKGQVGATHTIKQIGGDIGGSVNYRAYGIPKFTVGQRSIVFLYGKSKDGFSSPVGLGQGHFPVGSDETGDVVANGRDFRDMAQHLTDQVGTESKAKLAGDKPVRKMGLAEFKGLVRKRTATREMATGGDQQ